MALKINSLIPRLFKRGPVKPVNRSADARFITVMVITNGASSTRRLRMKTATAKALGAAAAVAVLTLAFVVYDYAGIRANSKEFYRLKEENANQKIELQNFSSKIRSLESHMARLEVFDKKLRIIANIEKPAEQGRGKSVMGIGGGPSTDAEDYLLTPGAKVDALVDQMRSDLTQLEEKADHQESSFTELQEYLMKKSGMLASTPSIWPARGWVTSTFGKRISPFTGLVQSHMGLDIANRMGTPVVAPAKGVVVRIARNANLGKYLVISHGYGIKTTYGHLSEINVKVGQRVKRGQKIAALGNTGRSTGAHLHYGVSVNGVAVNPSRYILN